MKDFIISLNPAHSCGCRTIDYLYVVALGAAAGMAISYIL